MRYFPLFLDLRDRPVLVVGGGNVAERKCALLRAAGARVTLVAPELNGSLESAVREGTVAHRRGSFEARDADGCTLVVAATDDHAVNASAAAAARARNIPVNVVDDPALSSFIVPSIIDRSPVQIAVSTGGASPVLARLLRERLESLLEESLGRLAEFADGWRLRLRRALPGVGERRQFVRWMLEGPVARAVRGGRTLEADALVESALASGHTPTGSVALVGAGPGDPGLLTLRALRLLQEADVILHDRLVSPAVLELGRRDAMRISVAKHTGGAGTSQAEINRMLESLARQGQRVVRLKGGDPLLFGRGGEELAHLRAARIPCEIVPGITAAFACAAGAGIPLTDRRFARVLSFATAHDEAALEAIDWSALAGHGRTLAVYMGVATLPGLTRRLLAAGIDAGLPAALIENGSLPHQRVVVATVGTLAAAAREQGIQAPALTILGAAAAEAAQQIHGAGAAPAEYPPVAAALPIAAAAVPAVATASAAIEPRAVRRG
jgi:uroporphyrin-III C-methyltransferase/precorrin-2 dehydrogenase/sirohydrochlorin ferrochelatase